MKDLNAAYKVLSNEELKRKYDYHLHHHQPQPDGEEGDEGPLNTSIFELIYSDDWEQVIIVAPEIIRRNWFILWGGWFGVLFLDWLFSFSLVWYEMIEP